LGDAVLEGRNPQSASLTAPLEKEPLGGVLHTAPPPPGEAEDVRLCFAVHTSQKGRRPRRNERSEPQAHKKVRIFRGAKEIPQPQS